MDSNPNIEWHYSNCIQIWLYIQIYYKVQMFFCVKLYNKTLYTNVFVFNYDNMDYLIKDHIHEHLASFLYLICLFGEAVCGSQCPTANNPMAGKVIHVVKLLEDSFLCPSGSYSS